MMNRRTFIKYTCMGLISLNFLDLSGCITSKKGKNVIQICNGKACKKRGAEEILKAFENELGIKDGETTSDLKFTVESVPCVDLCREGSVVKIGDNMHVKFDIKDVKKIVNSLNC